MTSRLLWRLLRERSTEITVLVIPKHRNKGSGQYTVRPRLIRLIVAGFAVVLFLGLAAVFVFTPITEILRDEDVDEMREQAITNSIRIRQLEDSLSSQREYTAVVAGLLGLEPAQSAQTDSEEVAEEMLEEAGPLHPSETISDDWADHAQPAVPVNRMSAVIVSTSLAEDATRGYLSGFQLPFLPPVAGLVTRGFNAPTGHYAVDIAVEAGSMVRSVGSGHVIVADWGYDGGWTLAVHHADGYVSVYKHNDRLLKRVGDRVLDREPVAISGNSGEITTGPHIHFELWHEGLAQDPERYFLK